MDNTTQEILTGIRDKYTVEQMMAEEDKLRRASEHLHVAHELLLTLQSRPDPDALEDLVDYIEEVDAAIGYFREARR